ncbi:MAG TPA: response regulator transcription factor [Vicinamibacteria bacterium]|nr:response regulator transcription factor [Vicinamibacteria bacterium]
MLLTVLIVDDDERFRELVGRLLGTGVRVVGEAARGEDAVLLATEVRPDVVLMDLDIPGLDGIAATRQIKAAAPRTKVILVTPYEEQAYLSSTGKTGADALLAKRAVRTEVLSQIRAVVGGFGSAWDGGERRGRGMTSGRWDGTENRRPQPSRETVAPVHELSTFRRTKEFLERVAGKAALVFDSFRQPLPAGVRGVGPLARRLVYKAGRYRVMLQLEPAADSDRLSLVGQILDEGFPEKPLQDLAVLVSSGRKTVDRTLTNRFGEFLLQPHPATNLRLFVEAPETGPLIVSLPSVGRRGPDHRTNARHRE